MIYFDACYIAKFYLAETDSAKVIAYAQTQTVVNCLVIGKAEVIAVFHRKYREQIVDENGYRLLCDQFEADCAHGLWQWLPLDDALLKLTANHFRKLPPSIFLRASDALHLGLRRRCGLRHHPHQRPPHARRRLCLRFKRSDSVRPYPRMQWKVRSLLDWENR